MMINQTPKISVLVPVYNAADFIAETVAAVLAQTYRNFELILLNDASIDNTAEIIAGFTDPRIKYVENERNLGIAASRNKLVSLAKGDYIAVLDHDDICLPNRLAAQADFLDANPDIAIVGSWFELFCPDTAPEWRQKIVNAGWVWCHPLRPTLYDARKGNVLMHPTAMYRRREFALNNIRYNQEFTPAEDYDLIYQVFQAGLKPANIPQVLLRYRLYGGNCSLTAKKKMKQADRRIKKMIWSDLHLPKWFFYPYILVILQKLKLKFLLRGKNV